MDDNFYKQVIDESPIGYAYHRIVCDEEGIPCDYEFIKVNAAFEKLTGLKGSDIVGRRVTEILPGIRTSEFDWIHFYGDIAINGGNKELEQFSEPLNKWYKINVYSPEKNYFVTHFIDLSKEIVQLNELKNLQEIIKETELKYKTIVDYSYDWETWEDETGKFKYISSACERISGYTVDEFVENDSLFASIIAEEDKEIWLNHRHEIEIEKGAHTEQFRIINKDGKIVWIEHNCRPIIDKKGMYLGYRANNCDITDRKYSEEMIKDSEKRFRIIFEQASVGICNTSTEGRFLMANQKLCEILGYSREELTEIKFNDIMHPDDINISLEGSTKLLNGSIEQFLVEKRYFRKDGSIIWVNLTSTLMKDSEGKPNYFITVIHDITESKMMEESLKKSEEEYRLLFENAVEAIVVIQNREIQKCNPMAQRLTGYSEKELNSMPFLDIIYCEDVENVRNIHNICLKEEGFNSKQIFRLVRKNNEIRWVEANGIKINWKGKEAVLNFVIDVTERKQAEEALQMNQRKLMDIIDFLPDATLAIDKENRVIIWNKAIEKMTSIPASEMIDKGDYAYTIPFYGKARPQLLDLLFLSDEEIVTQYSKIAHEGDALIAEAFCPSLYKNKGAWVFAKASPLHDQFGNITGAIESIRDITERKQVEDALKESEKQFKATFELAAVGIVHVTLDGKFIRVNQKFCDLVGYTQDELLNMSIMDITHPKDLENHSKDLENHLGNMTKQLNGDINTFSLEKRYIKKDNTFIWVNLTVSAVNQHSGKFTYVMGVVEDISERKHAEEALKSSEYTLRTLFEDASDAVFIIDDHKVIDCNQACLELLGYDTKDSVLGKSPWELSPEKQPNGELSKDKIFELSKTALKNGMTKFEWWYQKNDNTLIIVEIVLTSILLEGQKVFHASCRDISDRKQMEQNLEYLSYYDQLTGLYNRRFYEEELKKLDTERNLPLTIVMGDVNGLKLINDSFGHTMGDELLKKIAEVLRKGCRADDIIARLAGDEFVIVLPKTDAFETEQIIKRITDLSLSEKVSSIDISISFGYETKNNQEEKIQDIFKKAEDHMYKKKLFESPSMRGKTISAIVSTLHEKSKREEQHSLRVSALCKSMGEALGLFEYKIEELRSVGLLHDIGKIAIDENILNKPGKLEDEEWKEIKRHPEIGYRILSTVNDMSEMAEYVLAHHERWDGKGYPRGLKGEEIPFESRIIAIADAYDAMTSERSYRSALPNEVAVEELQKNAGIQFDPKLVYVFIEKVLDKI